MRNTFLLFVLVSFTLLAACHKNEHPVCCEPFYYFADSGSWRLVQVSGGIGGRTTTIPADSLVLLALHGDWRYNNSVNGHTTDTGRFGIAEVATGTLTDTIGLKFSGDTSILYLCRASLDRMVLTQFVSDGFQFTYLKNK